LREELKIEKCKLQIRFEATSVAYAEPKLWFEAYATVPRKVLSNLQFSFFNF